MKKMWKIALLCVVWLVGCWLIGHYRKANQVAEGGAASSFTAGKIIGSESTDDNPWGKTAGIIDMDEEGQVVMLTPATGYDLKTDGLSELKINYQIHPWVKDLSDGAELVITVLDKKGKAASEDKVFVEAADDWKEFPIEISDGSTIQFRCYNGKNNDSSGDWVILK